MDHGDGQERAPGGQSGCGNPRRHAQMRGVQARHAPQGLQSQGGQDLEGVAATTQHIAIVKPNETMR